MRGVDDTADYYRLLSTLLGLPATRRDVDAAELKIALGDTLAQH